MRPTFIALLIATGLAPLPAFAQGLQCHQFPSGGVNLRWDHCYGDGGTTNKSFACDTNAGTEVLVGSFVSNTAIPLTSGLDAYIDVSSSSGVWPDWWSFGPGCRASSSFVLSTTPDPAETVCQNLWIGAAGGTSLSAGYNGTGTRLLRAVLAVPPGSEFTIPAGVEMLGFRLIINHAKTVGPSACGGCSTPMCLALSEIAISTADQPCFLVLSGPANGTDSHLATARGAAVSGAVTRGIFTEYFQNYSTSMNCSAATSTRRSTWGQIQSFYR